MQKLIVVWAVLTAALFGSVTAAYAVDPYAPPWRGMPETTYQVFAFGDPSNPAAPTLSNNNYGTASASIDVEGLAEGWFEELEGFGTRTGYWDLGTGSITIDIPNTTAQTGFKEIWIKVICYEELSEIPTVTVEASGAVEWLEDITDVFEPVPPFGQWTVLISKWKIVPNPLNERVVVTAGSMFGSIVDEIAIDTICVPEPVVPEPASIAALIAGCSTLLLRRRRVA